MGLPIQGEERRWLEFSTRLAEPLPPERTLNSKIQALMLVKEIFSQQYLPRIFEIKIFLISKRLTTLRNLGPELVVLLTVLGLSLPMTRVPQMHCWAHQGIYPCQSHNQHAQ
jgi:hypothetical protein